MEINKEEVYSLLSNDRLEEVLNLLKQSYKSKPSKMLKIADLQSRLSSIANSKNSGLLTVSEEFIERNKVRNSILALIQSIFESEDKRERTGVVFSRVKGWGKRNYRIVGLSLLGVLLVFISGYLVNNEINRPNALPRKLCNSYVNKQSIDLVVAELKKDSLNYEESFHKMIGRLDVFSESREEFIDRNGLDPSNTNGLKSAGLIDQQIDSVFQQLKELGITFCTVSEESNLNDELKEIREKEYQKIYSDKDSMCQIVQQAVDQRTDLLNSLSRDIVGTISVKKFEGGRLYVNRAVSNGCKFPVYSVGFDVYAVSYAGDTLTSMYAEISNENGIGRYDDGDDRYLYSYNQKHIIDAVRGHYSKMRLLSKLDMVNVDGKIFRRYYGNGWLSPLNFDGLPFNASYYENHRYTSPVNIKGYCPYYFNSNDYNGKLKSLDQEIQNEVEEAGYVLKKLISNWPSKYE